MQMPSTAAMVGLGVRSSFSAKPCTIGSSALRKSRSITSERSEPEAKARPPAPVRVMAFTASSSAAAPTACCNSSSVASEMALWRSGRLIVISAIGPSTS